MKGFFEESYCKKGVYRGLVDFGHASRVSGVTGMICKVSRVCNNPQSYDITPRSL